MTEPTTPKERGLQLLTQRGAPQWMHEEFNILINHHPLPAITAKMIKYTRYYTLADTYPDGTEPIKIISDSQARIARSHYWRLERKDCRIVSVNRSHRIREKTLAWAVASGLYTLEHRYSHPAPHERYVRRESNLSLALRRCALWTQDRGARDELMDMASANDELRREYLDRRISEQDYQRTTDEIFQDAREALGGELLERSAYPRAGRMAELLIPESVSGNEGPAVLWSLLSGHHGAWWSYDTGGVVFPWSPGEWILEYRQRNLTVDNKSSHPGEEEKTALGAA